MLCRGRERSLKNFSFAATFESFSTFWLMIVSIFVFSTTYKYDYDSAMWHSSTNMYLPSDLILERKTFNWSSYFMVLNSLYLFRAYLMFVTVSDTSSCLYFTVFKSQITVSRIIVPLASRILYFVPFDIILWKYVLNVACNSQIIWA